MIFQHVKLARGVGHIETCEQRGRFPYLPQLTGFLTRKELGFLVVSIGFFLVQTVEKVWACKFNFGRSGVLIILL